MFPACPSRPCVRQAGCGRWLGGPPSTVRANQRAVCAPPPAAAQVRSHVCAVHTEDDWRVAGLPCTRPIILPSEGSRGAGAHAHARIVVYPAAASAHVRIHPAIAYQAAVLAIVPACLDSRVLELGLSVLARLASLTQARVGECTAGGGHGCGCRRGRGRGRRRGTSPCRPFVHTRTHARRARPFSAIEYAPVMNHTFSAFAVSATISQQAPIRQQCMPRPVHNAVAGLGRGCRSAHASCHTSALRCFFRPNSQTCRLSG